MTRTENTLTLTGDFDPMQPETTFVLPGGRVVTLPTSVLLDSHQPPQAVPSGTPASQSIPVLEEQLEVEKRTVETGRLRLNKSVQSFDTRLDEALVHSTYAVDRVAVGKPVERAPEVRHQGNTTVYPILEERLVLTRQLVLVEELHITRHETTEHDRRTVTLRREQVAVERT